MDEDDEIAPDQSGRATFVTRFFNQWHRYKNLVLKYWWILVLTVVISEGIQVFLLWRSPPSFMSVGRMIVNVKLSIPNANFYSEELNNFFGTQVALMQSDSVIRRVLLRLQTANPPLNPAPVHINVTISPKTSIFNLSAVGSDALYTQAYLEATMAEYVNLKRDLLENASSATKSSLLEELAQLSSDLEKSKGEVLNYQSNNSVVFLQENGGNSAADYLATLTQQLADRKSELQMIQTLTLDENLERQQDIFTHQSAAPQTPQPPNNTSPQPNAGSTQTPASTSPPTTASVSPDNNSTPNMPANLGGFETAYLQVKQQILSLKAKRDNLSEFMRPKHPDIIALNDEINTQEKLLEVYKGQSQEQLKNRRHILELQIQDLQVQIGEWKAKAVDTSQKLSDYEVLKESQRRLQAMYDQMQSTLQTLDADQGINQESVSIFEPATPAVPAPSGVSKHLSLAGMIGLIFGAGILMLLNRLDDRPASYTELAEIFDEPILGQIPFIKPKDKKTAVPILQSDDDRPMLVEAYRNLRSALVFNVSSQSHPRSIVITSAIPSDGKSMTAANLAITLAEAGARVLLVDGDLRRGVMHKLFSVAASPGLAEVLAEQCAFAQTVVPTAIPNLYLLPCGKPPRHPGGLFVTQAEKFLKEIAGQYDYYLFDTAPIMAADDVSNLAPHVDGVIMVIRAGFTSGRVAKAALDLLALRKVKVTGLVFNAVRPNAGEYYYYRYKEYYAQSSAM